MAQKKGLNDNIETSKLNVKGAPMSKFLEIRTIMESLGAVVITPNLDMAKLAQDQVKPKGKK